ncbi:MAG TPA: threonine synthase [Anaerolineae bacterium]|nr:threonine synthase [Anaerolineae bacterium]
MSALLGLICPQCRNRFEASQLQRDCSNCASPLLARYDTAMLANRLDRKALANRPAGLWRWAELLPVGNPAFRFSLGEGDTPLLTLPRLAEEMGMGTVLLKDEGVNPTGTFKARGLATAVSRAAELGIREFVIPTAGNAGAALAAYAARAGLKAHVFMPEDAPQVNQAEVRAAGADLHLVPGLIDQAGKQAAEQAHSKDWFDVSTFKEPYRVEGKKTMGFELVEALGWELPEVIIYPTGGGTGLVGMWKAFTELRELGWINQTRPRFVSVQPVGCAPVVRAMELGTERIAPWEHATTRAHGLRVPKPYADRLILQVLRESGGTAVAVEEQEIQSAQEDLAQREGILTCLEGAATLAGLRKLVRSGWVTGEERVVLFNTGSGLKYLS